MRYELSVQIDASAEVVWGRLIDVERWPDMTASVSKVERLDAGPLTVGSRVRVEQPRMAALVWVVTELEPGKRFTWSSKSPGVTTTGRHELNGGRDGSVVVTLGLDQRGILAPIVWWLTGTRTRRYVGIEAEGLKRTSEG